MKDSHWFKRLEVALEFDSGFEIFLLLGRGDLARPALAAIAEQLGRFGAPSWHRLHLDDLDGLLTAEQPSGVLHLVHGFERMPPAAAANLAARLNLNRDRLEVLAGPVIFWIAEDFYEELLRQAPDFVAWRSQATVASDIESHIPPEVAAEEYLLCHAQIEAARACRDLPPLDIIDASRKPLFDWLVETSRRSFRYSVDDHPLRVAKWCAWQLARLREAGSYEWVPALLPSLLLTDMTGVGEGIRRLWDKGALDIVVAAPLSMQELEAVSEDVGGNRILASVFAASRDHASIAQLTEQQIEIMVERSFTDLSRYESEQWRVVMATTLRLFEDRICRVGVLAAVIAHWRHLGLSSVQHGLQSRAWREHSFRNAVGYGVDLEIEQVSGTLTFGSEIFQQPNNLALKLYGFGKRMQEAHQLAEAETLLRASMSLSRTAGTLPQPVFVLALISLAENLGFDEEKNLLIWREAACAAKGIEPLDSRLLLTALDGLAFCAYLCRHLDEAEQTLNQALALADESVQDPIAKCRLLITRAKVLQEQAQFSEAIAVAEEGLGILHDTAESTQQLRIELWEICDESYSSLGQDAAARAAAAHAFALQRRSSHRDQMWALRLTLWGRRLFEAGELEEAQTIVREAVVSPGVGSAPLILLAEICWALGQRVEAIEAMQEAVRMDRAFVSYGGSPAWVGLPNSLLSLAGYLAQLHREEDALQMVREAVALLEQERQPSQYPADLVSALRQLGDLAATRQQFGTAVSAYERILALAEPFPARTSDPVLADERRLEDIRNRDTVDPDA